MKNVLIITLAVVGLLGAQVSWAELLVFGPDIYTNTPGKSQKIVKTFSVQNPQKKFTISIQSVEGAPRKVGTAAIELNGIRVIRTEDFKPTSSFITKPIKLKKENKIAVEVKSEPGTWVAVSILGPERPSVKVIVSPRGGIVTLKGFASVIFPPGAFLSNTPVTVSATSSPKTAKEFSETAEGPRVPYEIRINSSSVAPLTSFDVILDVPESFITSLPPDTPQIEIFAQMYDEGDEEILDLFHGFPSTFDPLTNKVSTTLPNRAFTNRRGAERGYGVIVIVEAIPSYPAKGSQGE